WQGRSLPRMLRRLRRRSRGRALLEQRPALDRALADWRWLGSLPEGSLGRAYLDFCGVLGTTKAGMKVYVDEGTSRARTVRLPPDERFVQDTLFQCHDLYHLVAGYETDLVGEVCLLAFTAAQTRNTGVLAMALLGAFSIRLPRLQGQRLMLDAARRALRARWFVEQDWVALLPRPLDEVQRELGVWPPPRYERLWIGRARRDRASSTA
ncbi:MAG: hypothetical protein KDK70_26370, partial [Myxococcales bacterium]|nr:hypothetical protein [Myxococcales bacterium]